MHEIGMCEAIVEAAVLRAAGRRVTGVRVRLTGHPVDPGVIEQGVHLAAAGTVVEGASVELAVRPPTVRCRDCDGRTEATGAASLVACPRCGGVDVEAVADDEVVLEAISYEKPAKPEKPQKPQRPESEGPQQPEKPERLAAVDHRLRGRPRT